MLINCEKEGKKVHPVPCTLYLVPCTLYLVPCTLYVVRCTLYLAPCTKKRGPVWEPLFYPPKEKILFNDHLAGNGIDAC